MEYNSIDASSMDDNCAVKIAIRMKPTLSGEPGDSILKIHESKKVILVSDRAFVFDYILGENVNQQDVYEELMKPLVEKLIKGFHCTVLAYGQTGAGKTYTMGLHSDGFNGDHAGMVSRALADIFLTTSRQNEEILSNISVSYIEIYNEKVYDLLSNNYAEPTNVKGFKIPSAIKEPVTNINEAQRILIDGNRNRHVRPTKMNANSSRSHGIFTIHVETKTSNSVINSVMHLVDLAGSEGVRRTGHQGIALAEGVHINQGLLSVGKVLQALSNGCKVIPYRDSVLSTVLQDSLNSNSYLTLMACVSTIKEDLSETMSTLRFAENAKLLRNNPKINSIISELKKQNIKTPTKLFNGNNNQGTKRTPLLQTKLFNNFKSLSTIKKPSRNTICTPKINKYEPIHTYNLNHSTVIRRERLPIDKNLFAASYDVKAMNESLDSHTSFNFNASTSTEINTVSSVVKQSNFSPVLKRIDKVEATLQKIYDKIENRNDIDDTVKSDLINIKNRIYSDICNDPENIFKVPNAPKINIMSEDNNENYLPETDTKMAILNNTIRRSVRLSSIKQVNLNMSSIDSQKIVNEVNYAKIKTKKSHIIQNKVIASYFNSSINKNNKKVTKTQHKTAILDIINNGNNKELQLLPQIGLKTAFQIVMHRTLNGKFKNLKELSKLHAWRGNKGWTKFEMANNLC